MNIDLKLKPETLLIVSATLQSVYNTKAHTRRHKSTLSIALEVSSKIDSKLNKIKGNKSQIDAKKPIKISLKFFEADMLELLLIDQMKFVEETFIRQQLQSTIDFLNQKLA